MADTCRGCGYEFPDTGPRGPCPSCGATARNTTASAQLIGTGTVYAHAIVWGASSFARDWFADALEEALAPGRHARRREIIFAVCCAESYLFEWARDEALRRDFREIGRYFPVDDKNGITERWKGVLKHLFRDGRISSVPDFGLPYWQEFRRLVQYRNGLIHGGASRPYGDELPDDEGPMPQRSDLETMAPGWPTRVIVALVQQLLTAARSTPPDWLREP